MRQLKHIYKRTDKTALFYAWGEVMYTRLDVVFSHSDETFCVNEANKIVNILSHIEEIGNRFDQNSELSRLNSLVGHSPVPISNQLYEILLLCRDYWNRTAGYFDITVSESSIGRMTQVEFNECNKSIRTPDSSVRFDLSGFLKGYALDIVKSELIGSGIENALISLGNSSILAIGNHPYGDGWSVDAQGNATGSEVFLKDSFLTTSSNLSTGKHHLISPVSGAVIDATSKFSVISTSGADGEAFTTAIAVADLDKRDAILSGMKKSLIRKSDKWELYG